MDGALWWGRRGHGHCTNLRLPEAVTCQSPAPTAPGRRDGAQRVRHYAGVEVWPASDAQAVAVNVRGVFVAMVAAVRHMGQGGAYGRAASL